MHHGLTMSAAEKELRHAKLYEVVTTHTSQTWGATLAKLLLSQLGAQNLARMTPHIPRELLQTRYVEAKKRLFLFDYDVRLPSRHFCFFSFIAWGPIYLFIYLTSSLVRAG